MIDGKQFTLLYQYELDVIDAVPVFQKLRLIEGIGFLNGEKEASETISKDFFDDFLYDLGTMGLNFLEMKITDAELETKFKIIDEISIACYHSIQDMEHRCKYGI